MSENQHQNLHQNMILNAKISGWLKEDLITHAICEEQFLESLSDNQKEELSVCNDVNSLCDGLDYTRDTFPFVYLFLKPQPAKKSTRYFALLEASKMMRTFNLATGYVENMGIVESVQSKPKRTIFLKFSGEQHPREFSVKQPYVLLDKCIDTVINRNTPDQSHISCIEMLFRDIAELPEEAPHDLPPELFKYYKESLIKQITTANTTLLQSIQTLPLVPAFVRDFGTLVALLCVKNRTVAYTINSIIDIYFSSLTQLSMIMRQECFVIRILNQIRNIFCQNYIDDLITKIMNDIESMNSADEFIPATLKILKENPPPAILRLLLAILKDAAIRQFPDSPEAPLIAISSLLLLRGLGPKLIAKNPNFSLKFSMLSLLFNFTNNSNYSPYISELQGLLLTFAVYPKLDELNNVEVSEVSIQDAVGAVFNQIAQHSQNLLEVAQKAQPIEKDGVHIFLEKAIHMLQKQKESA